MGWKDFFRLTKGKIGLILIVILAFNFIPIIPCKTIAGNGPSYTDSMLKSSLCNFEFPIGGFFSNIGWTTNYFGKFRVSGLGKDFPFNNTVGNLLAIFYITIISYLLSCLIIFLYGKIKNRGKR